MNVSAIYIYSGRAKEIPSKVFGLPLHYYKNIHGGCMVLAYAMLFGAGDSA